MTEQDEQQLKDVQSKAQRSTFVLNIVCKWRTVLAGWQLGTRTKGDPEADAVRDQRELLIALRAEVTALTAALVERGGISRNDFLRHLETEARELDKAFEKRFPGFRASNFGMIVYDPEAAKQTMKGWRA